MRKVDRELDLVVPRELMNQVMLNLVRWHDSLIANGDRPAAEQVAEVIIELRDGWDIPVPEIA
jgi:hypothetical protein